MSIRLRLSDPAFTERLVSFMASVGCRTTVVEPDLLEVEASVPEAELAVYLRVWHVLHPEAVVTQE